MLMTHFIWQTVLKPLSVYECQERSNHPFSHSYNAGKVLQCRQVGAGNMERYNQFIEACRSSLGVVLGDHVDGSFCACACGCVCLCNLSKHVGALLVVDLGILWLLLVGESFYAYLQCRPADW